MRSDARECVGWLSIPPLIGTETAVITRYFATPLRSNEAIADVDPDVIGQNHVKQGDPLLELSDGQILCAPCDGDLDWCVPVGTTVSRGTPFGQFMEEPELSSRTILVQIRLPSWPYRPRANKLAALAKLSRWFTVPGDEVRRGDPVAEFITDEGQTLLVRSPLDGMIRTTVHFREFDTASSDTLRAHPPETEIVIPATYDRLMDGTSTKTHVRVSPDARRDLTPDADRIVGLCLPSWEWLKAQPEGSLTRHPSLSIDGEGLVPYVFTGKPATLDVPLLGRAYGLSKTLGDGASRALVDWLRLQVSWWKNPSTGRFQVVRYKKGPGSIPFDWLQRVLDSERKEPAERWQETLRERVRDSNVTIERLDSLSDAHFRRVPVEQKVLLQFRRDLDHVLPALLEEPITLGQSKVTSKDVAQTLQHLPRRQAYVRIGTATHAMETLPLREPVDADEERRRLQQLQEQTRRRLCRHVSELATGGGPDEPGAAGGSPRVDPRPPQPPQPTTSAGWSATPPQKPRLRRSRPLP